MSVGLFTRKTDDELRGAGFDPARIQEDENDETVGPFRVYRLDDAPCGNCGSHVAGATVINIATATCVTTEWSHAEAFIEAEEAAERLNAVWEEGVVAAENEFARNIQRRTPRSTNTFLQEYLGQPPAEGEDPAAKIVFEERNYGKHVGVGFMTPDGKRHAVVVRREAMIRVARAVLARWPEPIEDAEPAPPADET